MHPSSMDNSVPQDEHESPVSPTEVQDWENEPDLAELVLAVARFRAKGYHHAGDACEGIMWQRAFTETKGT